MDIDCENNMPCKNNKVNESTQSDKHVVTIDPPKPQMYPRTHFFGIPQELQDLIVDEVWRHDTPNSGASSLLPLLTCRHFYHLANEKAWARTSFDIRSLSDKTLSDSLQRSLVLRRAHSVTIEALQMGQLTLNARRLPHIGTLMLTDFDIENTYTAGKAWDWLMAIMRLGLLGTKVDRIMASAAVFEDKMAQALFTRIRQVNSMSRVDGDGPDEIMVMNRMKQTAQMAERYLITVVILGKVVRHEIIRSDQLLP